MKELTISNTLKDLGITPGYRGYTYLKFAIGLAMDDMSVVHSVMKRIYGETAAHYDVNPTSVERCIRHAIEVAWNEPATDTRNIIFRNAVRFNRGVPTNGEFIATVSDYLLMTKEE